MTDSIAMRLLYTALFYLAAFLTLRVVSRRTQLLARIPVALNLLVTVLGAHLFLAPIFDAWHPDALNWLRVMLLFLSLYVSLRFADIWLFEVVLPRKRTHSVPQVLRDILRWVLTLVALLWIVRTVFPDVNLNVLAFSSIVVGYVLGNASQDTLGNLISGLALNTESPFSIGDWVEVGGYTGQVVDMTWRATCLRTKMHDYVTLPNAVISRDPIINYSRPTKVHGYTLDVGVNYGVPPNKVRRVLLDAVASVPEVLASPISRVWLVAYNDFSIDYKIKFFIRDFTNLENIQSKIMDRIWYHFKRADIVIPFPIRDVNLHQVSDETEREAQEQRIHERVALLGRVALFEPLNDAERALLADRLKEHVFAAGEVLVKEGDAGTTFYLIADGGVRVVSGRGDREVTVAQLGAGEFFGEMSLLTGERRNASVIAETDTHVLTLSNDLLRDILEQHEELAESMAAILSERQQKQVDALQHIRPEQADASSAPSQTAILGNIRRFFGLARHH